MQKEESLTRFGVKKLVYTWFRKITDHAPVEEMIDMLDSSALEMTFPEATLKNTADFKEWYKTVIHKFFDQVHEVKMLDVELEGDTATVHLVVNWHALTWEPPAPYSKWEGVYAHQNWTVRKDRVSGKPVITKYYVTEFESMGGPSKT